MVTPARVVANWAAEAARFAPELSIVAISDTLRRAGTGLDELVAGADVVDLFRLDFDAHAARVWSGLTLDEVQYVKNHHAKTYQCARRLAAPFKLASPVHRWRTTSRNCGRCSRSPLPGCSPPDEVWRILRQAHRKTGGAELVALFRRRIKPLVKRSTKGRMTAELPAKQQQVLDIELPPPHRALYDKRLHRGAAEGARPARCHAAQSIFLISLKAGGFGLNLNEANYCFQL